MNNNKPQKMLEKERFDAMKQEDMNEVIRDAERFRRIKSILWPLTLCFSETLEEQESMITTVDDMLLSQDMQDVFTDRTLIQPKAKELFLSLLRENFSPEQTDKFSELQFLTTLQLAYKFEDMIDISKSSLSRWLLDEGYQTTTFEGNLAWVMYTRKTNI